MNSTWSGQEPDEMPPLGVGGWTRLVLRGGAVGTVVFGGLAVLLLVRLVERPVHGLRRPWTPYITQTVCRAALRLIGLELTLRGQQMRQHGAIVANHSSWLDIFVLNSRKNIYFVSKSEVANWPGIGWLARATGTLFIRRDRRHARAQTQLFEDRLLAGHKLLFFPEGTSTDGLRVLPFKSTLYEAFFSDHLRHEICVQPVTLIYHAPEGKSPRFYGWWGDMDFGSHLVKTLAAPRQGRAELIYHAPLRVDDFPNRKSLALATEEAVRSAHKYVLEDQDVMRHS